MKKVEDIYELAPLQEGLLFETLRDPHAGIYILQSGRLLRKLDVAAFREAWQRVIHRHPTLRTSFEWESLSSSVQIVHREVVVPFREEDWRELSQDEQERRLRDYLEADRRRGFNLNEAPALRIALFRVTDTDYRYVWSRHHILMDGWSVPLLVNELFAFYRALRQGRGIDAPAPRAYREYIAWLQRQDLGRAEAFWRQCLNGFSTPTPLPFDRPSTGTSSAGQRIRSEAIDLGPGLTASLTSLARRAQCTLNVLVQGCWALMLSRHSARDDVVFGTTVSGRPADLPGVEGMLGLFINTLPVRVRVPAGDALIPWLKELHARQVEMQQYEYSPLVKVQGWSDVPRGSPLFESLVIFENLPTYNTPARSGHGGRQPRKLPGGGLVRRGSHDTSYPLSLFAAPLRNGLVLSAGYATPRFDAGGVRVMLEQMCALLADLVAHSDRRLGELGLSSAAERACLVNVWNGTTAEYPHDACIQELFEAQAACTPNAVAVSFDGQDVTYGELEARANQFAHYLHGAGVGPDVLVAVCVERSAEMVAALLGVLKAGGAYVPLDPAHPRERLALILEEAEPAVLLTEERLLAQLPHARARVLHVDRAREILAGESCERPTRSAAPDHLAYVIFTSGSTGRPKGVQVTHRAVVNFLTGMRREPGMHAADVLAAVTTLSFDIAGLELFLPLCTGGRVEVIPQGVAADGPALLQYLADCRATVLQATPATWRLLLDAGWHSKPRLTILCGGEAMPRELASELLARGAAVWNLYGPTETTIWSCAHRVDDRPGPVPIGRPIANTQVYVLDRDSRVAPVGVVGDLFIAGTGLARGYLKHAGLTAERFVPNPFVGTPGARMYCTGDLARRLPGGELEYVGRSDLQVKIRGFRIELGDLEAALEQHPGVRQAVAAARPERGGSMRLVAYVVCADTGVGAAELREFLQRKLPPYMVPSAFMMLPALPLTPNGKVNRSTLPDPPDGEHGEASDDCAAPRGPTEEVLAGIWSEVLGIRQVGVQDNFFELGGHSLLATRVVSRIRVAFKVEVPLRAAFESPTIAGMAEHVEEARREQAGVKAPRLVPAPRNGEVPLSYAQQRLWFLDQLEPNSAAYNMSASIRLEGEVHVEALERALGEIVRRHESLRTTFPAVAGRPVQVIGPSRNVCLRVIDLSDLPASERETEARRLALAEAGLPFDLARGPLLRAGLLRLGPADHVLLLTIHHIVYDGWSQGVLMREFRALYRAFAAGRTSPLPEPRLQYADYAVWQRAWLSGEILDRQLAYWKARLDGVPHIDLPTDWPRPAVQRYRGARATFELAAEVLGRLEEVSRRHGATLFMTLLAAFQALLSRYSGQSDIAVGTPIAGRTRKEIEGLIGFFVNTLVLRTDLSGNPTFDELVGRVREVCLGAYTHQDLPFEKLVDELQLPRDPSRNPLFQVLFALQTAPRTRQRFGGLALDQLDIGNETIKFDLIFMAFQSAAGLRGVLRYNTDLFSAETMEKMADHLRCLLEGVATNPARPVAALPLEPESSVAQVAPDGADVTDVEQLLQSLDQLSDEAVNALLSKELLAAGQKA